MPVLDEIAVEECLGAGADIEDVGEAESCFGYRQSVKLGNEVVRTIGQTHLTVVWDDCCTRGEQCGLCR
jgi:hypothetical protein